MMVSGWMTEGKPKGAYLCILKLSFGRFSVGYWANNRWNCITIDGHRIPIAEDDVLSWARIE